MEYKIFIHNSIPFLHCNNCGFPQVINESTLHIEYGNWDFEFFSMKCDCCGSFSQVDVDDERLLDDDLKDCAIRNI